MPYSIRPFTEGMIRQQQTAEYAASYAAARASRQACDEVFKRGGSAEEANAASQAAYAAAIALATQVSP